MTDGGAMIREPAASYVHRGIGRTEFFDLTDAELDDLGSTLDALTGEGRNRFSFHAPIVRPDYFPHTGVTCFFLSEDAQRREMSFQLLGDTLGRAERWGAEYVVCHLTYAPTDTTDTATAHKLAEDSCARIAAMSTAAGMPVDIEFAAYTDAFNCPDRFTDTVARHPELGICIDIGHAYIGSLLRQRDFHDDIAALAPIARSMHLWNTAGPEHNRRHGHVPLHPSQRPDDGWIDVAQTLHTVLSANDSVNIIFEYPISEITPEIQAGYDWVADIAAAGTARWVLPGGQGNRTEPEAGQ